MYSTELETAKQAAHAAADIVRSYEDENKSLDISFKGKNDIVTNADKAAEEIIINTIKKAFPDDLFLAEESHDSLTLSDKRTWIIDPIDGTTNFAHGFPIYCVSIALWENKKAKVGVILDICRNELFSAQTGMGAFVDNKPIKVSQLQQPQNSLILTSFPSPKIDFLKESMDLFCNLMEETQGPRRPGSAAYDLISIASGRCDGYYVYGLSPWDVAAGGLIIQEAGGLVTDWSGNDDWLFGKRLVAGNAMMHKFLVNKLKAYIPAKHLA
ncbi:MAG: inositol monophosphatase family protein [Balneolales bacterium]